MFQRTRQWLFVKLAVIYLRYLMGFAFVFASPIKILGKRFTTIPVDQPVGYFFEALYQTGLYWRFLGVCQFIAGTLLMTQRFSTIGAIAYLAVILNVFMITISIDFGMGTPIVTGLMLMGCLFLLSWDYRKLIILVQQDLRTTVATKDVFMSDPLWAYTGIGFIVLTVGFQISGPTKLGIVIWVILMLGIGIAASVLGLWRERKRRLSV